MAKVAPRSVLGGAAADNGARSALALAEELISLTRSLGEPDRQIVVERLASAGLMPGETPPLSGDGASDVKAALKIPADEHVDPARMNCLLALLIEFIQIVDSVTWNLWTAKTHHSPVRRRSEIVPSMAALCRGGDETQRDKTERDVRKLMALNSAILVSLPRVASPLFQKAFGPLLPDQIKVDNPAPATSLFRGKETGWWQAYEKQAGPLTADLFETLFFQEVADKAGEMIPPEYCSRTSAAPGGERSPAPSKGKP